MKQEGQYMGNKQGEPLRELAGHRGRRGIEAEPSRCPESRRWIRGSRQLESLRQRNRDQENSRGRDPCLSRGSRWSTQVATDQSRLPSGEAAPSFRGGATRKDEKELRPASAQAGQGLAAVPTGQKGKAQNSGGNRQAAQEGLPQ